MFFLLEGFVSKEIEDEGKDLQDEEKEMDDHAEDRLDIHASRFHSLLDGDDYEKDKIRKIKRGYRDIGP